MILPDNDPGIQQRNNDLAEKFESCVSEANNVSKSFDALVQEYIAT
jgi:hypothetical protein